MFLLNWYREYLEIKNTTAVRKRELQYCEACETLKLQLAIANEERKFLINKLTTATVEEEVKRDVTNLKPLLPSRMNWSTRRQQLESEDRQEAVKILKKKQDELASSKSESNSKVLTIHEIEKELGVENG